MQGGGEMSEVKHCTRCPWSDPYAEVGMRLPCEGVAIPSASKQGDEPVAWMCKHSRAPYEYCGSVSSGRVAPQGRHVPFDRWPTCPGDWQPLYPAPPVDVAGWIEQTADLADSRGRDGGLLREAASAYRAQFGPKGGGDGE